MKMFRVTLISKKSYRDVHHNIYKALVLAETEEEALDKVNASLGCELKDYGEGVVSISDTYTDVYTF